MKKFEYLEASGTNEEVGRAIGSRFKEVIQRIVARRQKRIKGYDSYLRKTEPFFLAAKEHFPDLALELAGIAHGAGVGLADCFALNNHEVGETPDHCTVAVSFGEKGAIIGHNEDWKGAAPEALYVLKATIGDTTFMGLQYKVLIPGASATMNNWGLTQCINDLNLESQVGVPKSFVARAVLTCHSLDEAETLIRRTKRASGYNHVLVQGREVRNIEIAGDHLAVQKSIGVPYIHTNHFLSPEMKKFESSHTKSSEARYNRALELIKPNMTKAEMKALLSDIENIEYPISRRDATLGSFIAEPEKGRIYICYGPPDAGEFIEYAQKSINTDQ